MNSIFLYLIGPGTWAPCPRVRKHVGNEYAKYEINMIFTKLIQNSYSFTFSHKSCHMISCFFNLPPCPLGSVECFHSPRGLQFSSPGLAVWACQSASLAIQNFRKQTSCPSESGDGPHDFFPILFPNCFFYRSNCTAETQKHYFTSPTVGPDGHRGCPKWITMGFRAHFNCQMIIF